jgi:hypothetical protein
MCKTELRASALRRLIQGEVVSVTPGIRLDGVERCDDISTGNRTVDSV